MLIGLLSRGFFKLMNDPPLSFLFLMHRVQSLCLLSDTHTHTRLRRIKAWEDEGSNIHLIAKTFTFSQRFIKARQSAQLFGIARSRQIIVQRGVGQFLLCERTEV